MAGGDRIQRHAAIHGKLQLFQREKLTCLFPVISRMHMHTDTLAHRHDRRNVCTDTNTVEHTPAGKWQSLSSLCSPTPGLAFLRCRPRLDTDPAHSSLGCGLTGLQVYALLVLEIKAYTEICAVLFCIMCRGHVWASGSACADAVSLAAVGATGKTTCRSCTKHL